jgi:hypothetical protein
MPAICVPGVSTGGRWRRNQKMPPLQHHEIGTRKISTMCHEPPFTPEWQVLAGSGPTVLRDSKAKDDIRLRLHSPEMTLT